MPYSKRNKSDQSIRLKLFRKQKKLTQLQLADILKKEQTTISKYERGDLFIPPEDIKILRDSLGLSYEWFYNNEGSMDVDSKSDIIEQTVNEDLKSKLDQLELRIKKLESIILKEQKQEKVKGS